MNWLILSVREKKSFSCDTMAFYSLDLSFALLALIIQCNVCLHAYSPEGRLPFIRRQDLVGIWKLTHRKSLLPSTIDSEQNEKPDGRQPEAHGDIILRLNDDGSFDHYSSSDQRRDNESELRKILGRGGCWGYHDQALILAPERPKNGNARMVHDTLLTGRLIVQASQSLSEGVILNEREQLERKDQEKPEQDFHLTIDEGEIAVGKFMYPRNHQSFFEEPMLFRRMTIGTFQLSQVLGNLNSRLKASQDEQKKTAVAKFHKKDFYGRRFYLSTTPHKVNPRYAAADPNYDKERDMEDIRVIPITFHSNNTFTAEGYQKVLRGRFGLAGDERDRLWFQVNLFGAGRSAPGSVYSEGMGLTHEDHRGYLGVVEKYEQNNRTMLFVEGNVFAQNELGIRKLPLAMARFAMQEVLETEQEDCDCDQDLDDEIEDAFQ